MKRIENVMKHERRHIERFELLQKFYGFVGRRKTLPPSI
jgi:hypothetical protein